MAFCTNCGGKVEGQFCPQCGTPLNAAPASPAYYSTPPSAVAPPAKSSSGLKIVLFGCLGVLVLAGIVAAIGGFFVARKVNDIVTESGSGEAGALMAAARIAIAANPEIELISSDSERGILTVREKATGRTLTVNLKDVQRGKIVLTDEKGERVELKGSAEGDSGAIEITTKEGTARMGAGEVKLPSWLPAYPGAKTGGLYSANTNEGQAGTVGFESADSADKVAEFYENALKEAGLKTTRTSVQGGSNAVLMITGNTDANDRTANVTVSSVEGGGSKFNVTFQSKN